MEQIARYVFQYLEKGFFIFPHKVRVIVLSNDDESQFKILSKPVFNDGSEQPYTTGTLGEIVSPLEFRNWLMKTLLQVACQKPDSRLPEITEEDRKWMRFETK